MISCEIFWLHQKERKKKEGRKEGKKKENKETQNILVMMDIFITETVVKATQVCTYVQTHQIVYTNDVQFFCLTNYTSKKLGKK